MGISPLRTLLSPPCWVFDMDGVLADTTPIHARAFADVLAKAGVPFEDYTPFAGMPTDAVMRLCLSARGHPPSQGLVAELTRQKQERCLQLMESGLTPVPFVRDVLTRAHAAGKRLYVVSSASRTRTLRTLELLGILERFELIVTAEDIAAGKPNPAPYLELMKRIAQPNPNVYVVFEDSEAGIASARAAGMRIIEVAPGAASSQSNGADYRIRSFAEVLNAL